MWFVLPDPDQRTIIIVSHKNHSNMSGPGSLVYEEGDDGLETLVAGHCRAACLQQEQNKMHSMTVLPAKH